MFLEVLQHTCIDLVGCYDPCPPCCVPFWYIIHCSVKSVTPLTVKSAEERPIKLRSNAVRHVVVVDDSNVCATLRPQLGSPCGREIGEHVVEQESVCVQQLELCVCVCAECGDVQSTV